MCKNPTHDEKCGTCPQNPMAGPNTYWAPGAQVPTQFPCLLWMATLDKLFSYDQVSLDIKTK